MECGEIQVIIEKTNASFSFVWWGFRDCLVYLNSSSTDLSQERMLKNGTASEVRGGMVRVRTRLVAKTSFIVSVFMWLIVMAKSRITKCVACNVDLIEHGFVRFPCPNCGTELGRCMMCRHQSIPYSCPNCGFEGP